MHAVCVCMSRGVHAHVCLSPPTSYAQSVKHVKPRQLSEEIDVTITLGTPPLPLLPPSPFDVFAGIRYQRWAQANHAASEPETAWTGE